MHITLALVGTIQKLSNGRVIFTLNVTRHDLVTPNKQRYLLTKAIVSVKYDGRRLFRLIERKRYSDSRTL